MIQIGIESIWTPHVSLDPKSLLFSLSFSSQKTLTYKIKMKLGAALLFLADRSRCLPASHLWTLARPHLPLPPNLSYFDNRAPCGSSRIALIIDGSYRISPLRSHSLISATVLYRTTEVLLLFRWRREDENEKEWRHDDLRTFCANRLYTGICYLFIYKT